MKRNYIILAILLVTAMSFVACTDNDRELWLDAPETSDSSSYDDADLDSLHIEGRYLMNSSGQIVNLHGFAQTFSPYFNNGEWSNYDVDACLETNQGWMDDILDAGWKVNFVRQHMDPYWCCAGYPSEDQAYAYFDVDDFMKYLELVYIPMAEYANKRGLYVVVRPPGVSPETIEEDDDYHKYLIQVWDSISSHPKIKNNPGIMFEIANEPVNIVGTDGSIGSSSDAHYEALQQFLQPIIDVIRGNGANNICWLPGLGYQSMYTGCATYKVEGGDIGYAIHCYCGWYGSDGESEEYDDSEQGGYESFQQGWDSQVKPVADIAPIMVTEMDWAPSEYDSSWGVGVTGTTGGSGFGANFKYIVDNSGNVSWLVFTDQDLLADFVDEAPADGEDYTFLTDPEACPWPVYHWFQEYYNEENGLTTEADHGSVVSIAVTNIDDYDMVMTTGNTQILLIEATYSDGTTDYVTSSCEYSSSDENVVTAEGHTLTAVGDGDAELTISYTYGGTTATVTLSISATRFPLEDIDPSIWTTGSYDEDTHTLITGSFGFGGWQYSTGMDLSGYNYLVIELGQGTNVSGSNFVKMYDTNSYWDTPAVWAINSYRIVIDLNGDFYDESGNLLDFDTSTIYILGFWTWGGSDNAVVISRVYTTDEYPTDSYDPPSFE